MADDSVFARDRRIRSARLTMSQTFYLTTLNQFVGKNSDAWPSQTTIASVMNAAPRSVRKWQTELEAIGVIQVKVGKGRSSTNRYRLNLNSLPVNKEPHAALSDESETKRGTTCRPNEEPRAYAMRNHMPTERTRKEQVKEQSVSFPESLRTKEFSEAWNEWTQHRQEIRKTLKPMAVTKQLNKLDKWGETRAIAAINHSIEQGYTGLFEPNGLSSTGHGHPADDWQTVLQIVCQKYSPDLRNTADVQAVLTPEQFKAAQTVGLSRIANTDKFDKDTPAAYRAARKAIA